MLNSSKFFSLVFILCFILNFAIANAGDEVMQSNQQVNDFALSGFGDKGKKSWDLAGKSADIFDDTVKLKAVKGTLYEEKDNVLLSADNGNFNKKSGLVHLEDNVVLTTSSGAKLTSDTLNWDRKQQTITTDSRVNLDKNQMNLQGKGASAQTNLKKLQVNEDVRLDINQKTAADKMVITCLGSLDVDYGKNIAVFNDRVRVERPDITMLSDKLVVYFNTKKQKGSAQSSSIISAGAIDKIVASGHVQILQGENVSYSEEAVYTAVDKKLSLLGSPRLVIYQTEKMNAAFRN
ncbi:MAG: LPS export ABC transporter periplasmic protein LptC [Candidatus Omnitrophica bacterium]|jgi:LPS export ABC transporter protein LptC|nr:LPS export ABC transporter periplasmic protein LptC [Candidatus Omnitrophota bacterium]